MGKLKRSMTLIEVLVSLILLGLFIPSVISIFINITQQFYNVSKTQTVLNGGSFALKSMKTTIENSAYYIYRNLTPTPICDTSNSSSNLSNNICFGDKRNPSNLIFCYSLSNGQISSSSGNTIYELTDPNKVIASNFNIQCQRGNIFSPPRVKISFNLEDKSNINKVFPTPLLFQTQLLLKNR